MFSNFRIENDRLLGDFQAFESFKEDETRKFNRLFELAEKMPKKFGLSIVFGAEKVWATDDGDIPFTFQDEEPPDEAIFAYPSIRVRDVMSADFVDSPAANERGLFSQIDTKPTTMTTKAELQDSFDALSAEKETLSEKFSDLETQFEAQSAAFKTLSDEKDALTEELSAKSAKVEELEGALSEKSELFDAKEAEATELAAKLDEATGEVDELNEKVDLLTSLIRGESKEIAAFGDDVDGADGDYVPSKAARDKAIAEFAAQKGITEFAATVQLSRERPELWGKKK